ncbi:MAG: phosphoenolpyruvate-utilizing N-terminal domain-containing protein [Lachnospiraceae bacterium]
MELREFMGLLIREVGEANAAIFEMQQEILEDEDFGEKVTSIILEEKLNAEYAVQQTAGELDQAGAENDKNYIQGMMRMLEMWHPPDSDPVKKLEG